MESTASASVDQAATPLRVGPRSLAAAFGRVPDPRRVASVAYPLAAVLALAVSAILANALSELAIAQWATRQPAERLRAMGFLGGRTPCQSTLQRLFCKLDGQALAEALSAHFAPVAVPLPVAAGSRGVAIDGKAQRGRLPFQAGGCPVHALTAFCHERGVVLAQEPIERGEDKSEAELTVAPALVAGDPRTGVTWPGRVLTGDALFCQRKLCAQVLAAGGDYLVLVKENQPTLLADLSLLFDPPAALGPAALVDRRAAATRDRGHGRREEVRRLVASTDLAAYLDWPPTWTGRLPGLAGPGAGLPPGAHLARTRQEQAGGALRDHQPLARGRPPRAPARPQARALGHRERPAPGQGCHARGGPEHPPLRPGTHRDGLPARRRRQPPPPGGHPPDRRTPA